MRILATAALVFVLALSVLASMGYGPLLFKWVNDIPGRDVTAHFVLMTVLALLVNLAFFNLPQRKPVGMFRLTLVLLILVTAEEVAQFWIPARNFSWPDMYASWGGILVGFALAGFVSELRRARDLKVDRLS